METLKGLLKSKVFLMNAASIILELSNQLAPLLPPGQILIAVNCLNIILRFYTSKPLSEK